MILHPGPIKKNLFKELITDKLNKYRGLFLWFFIGLPFLVYFPFQWNWLKSGPVISEDIIAAVARVNSNNGTGSAFLVSPSKLITARHVIEGVQQGGIVTLDFVKSKDKLSGIEAKVIFIPKDAEKDYAVLELLKPLPTMPNLTLGTANDASINDQIKVIGFPGGLFSSSNGTITDNEALENPDFLQLWSGAWPGNSGGPVILENTNEVIGILIAGLEERYKGMTFAIKIDALKNDPDAKGIDWSK